MRIREILFNNVRAFRGEHRISFVDRLTDQVNPVTVIAGTNGTGKTTILETVQELFSHLVTGNIAPNTPPAEALKSADSFIQMIIELSATDRNDFVNPEPGPLHILVGNVPTEMVNQAGNNFHYSAKTNSVTRMTTRRQHLRWRLKVAVEAMLARTIQQHGGLVYFPQTRQPFPASIKSGVIEEQLQNFEWLSQVDSPNQWKGSLEALWVWQNYLDLEAGAKNGNGYGNHANLHPFIELVEDALGHSRGIIIQQGRVLVQTGWQNNGEPAWVRLDQLPFGEQQLLFLLGELIRRGRPGGVIAIDEPETSLHPSLQRMLVYKLMKLAKEWDCQLILATHSLEIMRSVHASRLINLDHLDHYERHLEAYAEAAA